MKNLRAHLLLTCAAALIIATFAGINATALSSSREISQLKTVLEMTQELAGHDKAKAENLLKVYLGDKERRMMELKLQHWSVFGGAFLSGLLPFLILFPRREALKDWWRKARERSSARAAARTMP